MGIRFACPKGHPLHVKAELAGRRGICPHCQTKFVIPSPEPTAVNGPSMPATAPVQQRPSAASQPADQSVMLKLAPEPAPQRSTLETSPQPPAQPRAQVGTQVPAGELSRTAPATNSVAVQPTGQPIEAEVWYLRPSTGGQFGPATDALLRQWVAEGRVGTDAYVWRTGWTDWRRATEVDGLLPQPATNDVPPSPFQPSEPAESPAPASIATARIQQRKKRSAQGQMIAAIVLILLAVALAGVLVVVVRNSSQPVEGEGGEAAAPVITAPADDTAVDDPSADVGETAVEPEDEPDGE